VPKTKPKDQEQAIQKAIEVLTSQGRDVTTSAILSTLYADGIRAKPSDIHASVAWKELLAKEKGTPAAPASETKDTRTTKEKAVAKNQKKPNFPSKTCPKCNKLIHARSHSHPECGWTMAAKAAPAPVKASPAKKLGRPKAMTTAGGGISLDDIRAVKALADKIGAEKVKELAMVLGK